MSRIVGSVSRGFTIVELAIVIIVIGLLASVVVVTYNGAQGRARDAGRIDKLKKVEDALELYHADNKTYPLGTTVTALTNALSPTYITLASNELSSGGYSFTYVGQASSYGLMVTLEGTGGANTEDGGYYENAYEVGSNPAYCKATYTGTQADWVSGSSSTRRCNGGN